MLERSWKEACEKRSGVLSLEEKVYQCVKKSQRVAILVEFVVKYKRTNDKRVGT